MTQNLMYDPCKYLFHKSTFNVLQNTQLPIKLFEQLNLRLLKHLDFQIFESLEKIIVRVQQLVNVHKLAMSFVMITLYSFDINFTQNLKAKGKNIFELHERE